MAESMFTKLSDDVVLNIFFKLEDDPRNWARLSCVCKKFSSLIRTVCCKSQCLSTIPCVSADLLHSPDGWASIHKIAVCCPGLHHAGVLLDYSDFGLDRDLGPDDSFKPPHASSGSRSGQNDNDQALSGSDCGWSLYDDLYFDTIYDNSESLDPNSDDVCASKEGATVVLKGKFVINKKRKVCREQRSHLASGVWNLSREQGVKLLASRFREDRLYICDWPGCMHILEKRNYMLFRGIFKNFKKSRVWRTINDENRRRVNLNCAFCGCKETWDLHSAFCLKRIFWYGDDGEPHVRAYVCENGHVSGAWTGWPLYT